MSNNVEKFVIDLGFSSDDLKKLKDLLKLQRNETAKELAFLRKKNQMVKLIAKAEKEGVDVSKYKKSLAAVKKIETLERRRIELDKITFEAQQANQKKAQKAKDQELATEKQITQEVKKRGKPQVMNQPSRQLFEKVQARDGADRVKRFEDAKNLRRLKNYHANRVDLRAQEIGLPKETRKELRKLARQAAGSSIAIQELNLKLRQYAIEQKKATMRTRKANIAYQGLNDSTRNLIRSYVSMFAVLEATTSINRVGQRFESMNSAMLAATGTSELAQQEIEFLDKMTSRLGLSLLDASDAYSKFLFASKGKLDTEQTRELFEGLSELGTTLSVSKERMKLSMNAITQISGKSAATVM